MTTFLNKIAKDIIKNYKVTEFKDLLLIVPSKRVGLHLKKEMSNILKQTFWSPNIRSIDDFLVGLHELGAMDNVSIHFELYKVYIELFDEPEPFDSFQMWSSQIINDFNEIDRYMLDHKTVFSNLKNIKEIEQWSFNSEDLSENQNKFLIFWEKLGELYESFTSQLRKTGLATSANIYRDIAFNTDKYLNNINYKKIYILGFNALSKSEETIFKHLYQTSKAKLFWDIDSYYIKNKLYEAGSFIRNYDWAIESIKQSADNNIFEQQKTINIYPAKTSIDQINITAKIIEDNHAFKNEKSAVILSDETLLTPLINTIPKDIEKMNITMGYPIVNTLANELLNTCLNIIINNQKFNKNKSNIIYFKDLSNLIENPVFKLVTKKEKHLLDKLNNDVVKYNYTFVSINNLQFYLKDFHKFFLFLFYDSKKEITHLLDEIIYFIKYIRKIIIEINELNIEIESLYRIEKVLYKVKETINKYPFISTVKGLRNIIRQILQTEKLSFYGEPLQGLQIMGFLETRALDFENIVLLSCNESFLPGISHNNPLFPFDLKRYFNLPTKYDREAIFAYYFYRIIQRAKNIHLIYNNGISSGLESNEISRYIIQVENEFKNFKNIKINTRYNNYKFNQTKNNNNIEKNKDTIEKIDSFLINGISPSALNSYITCSLDFYYSYILRIKEVEEIEESIENSTLGTIIHKVLENLYNKLGPNIKSETIDKMLKLYKSETNSIFSEKFPQGNYKKGKNLLIFSMALKSIKQFLLKEREFIEKNGYIRIIGLEKDLKHTISIKTKYGLKKITLKGNADRIDTIGNTIRIIDYKTGYVTQKDIKKDINNLLENINDTKANQLMFYAYLYYKNYNKINITSGIFSLRNLKNGLLNLTLKNNGEEIEINEEVFDLYENNLTNKIAELYDATICFEHNKDAKYCMICL